MFTLTLLALSAPDALAGGTLYIDGQPLVEFAEHTASDGVIVLTDGEQVGPWPKGPVKAIDACIFAPDWVGDALDGGPLAAVTAGGHIMAENVDGRESCEDAGGVAPISCIVTIDDLFKVIVLDDGEVIELDDSTLINAEAPAPGATDIGMVTIDNISG